MLSKFVQRIDQLIDPLHVQAKAAQNEMEASLIALLRIKDWAWKTFLYLCAFTLYKGKLDSGEAVAAAASAAPSTPQRSISTGSTGSNSSATPKATTPYNPLQVLTAANEDHSSEYSAQLGSLISSNLVLLLTRNLNKLRTSLPVSAIRPLACGAITGSTQQRAVTHDLELKLEMNVVYQTVDILRLLQHTAASSTVGAVCSPQVVMSLIELLVGAGPSSASTPRASSARPTTPTYALPVMVQTAIVQLLRFELLVYAFFVFFHLLVRYVTRDMCYCFLGFRNTLRQSSPTYSSTQ